MGAVPPQERPQMTDDLSDGEEVQISETAHTGVSITAKVKRGTGTRDQDELVLKGKGADAHEATQEFKAALEAAEEGEWAERLRAIQPDQDSEDAAE